MPQQLSGMGSWKIIDCNDYYYYYTHLTASFPGQRGKAGIRKVKPVWI